MGFLAAWLGYGVGATAAKVLLGETKGPPVHPSRERTEADFLADEARYDEDERRLDAEDAAAKKKEQKRG